MSNEKRFEMTHNTENNLDSTVTHTGIDLESIPHPKDCYPVPDGAAIPPYTPCWVVRKHGLIEWVPNGYPGETIVGSNAALCLTPEPITPHPTPDDSPIIINHCQLRGAPGAKPSGLAVQTAPNKWVLVDDDGCDWWIASEEITDWSPAIVTKTGRGVWDERDKRDRINKNGSIVRWSGEVGKWLLQPPDTRSFGSLSAIRNLCGGDDYLVGFADKEGGEE